MSRNEICGQTDKHSDMTNQLNWNKNRETGSMKTLVQPLVSIQPT